MFARLHDSIKNKDFEEFKKIVDPAVTTFDPACKGHMLNGLSYHEFNLQAQNPNLKIRYHLNNASTKLISSQSAITTCSIVKQTSSPDSLNVSYSLNDTSPEWGSTDCSVGLGPWFGDLTLMFSLLNHTMKLEFGKRKMMGPGAMYIFI